MYLKWLITVYAVLVCFVVIVIVFSCTGAAIFRKRRKFRQEAQSTIFVMLPCYRDDECPVTLDSLFSKAKYPERISVGVCVQNKEGDVECPGKNYKNNKKVRTIVLSNENAKGPCYARFLISTLYRDEKYVLSVDCHTNFVQDWDTLCIEMLNECSTPKKSVLTTHPPQQYKNPSVTRTTHICKGKFNKDTVAFSSIEVAAQKKNMKTPFVGWGFIFMHGNALKEVPLDPYLDFMFEGEELLYAIRLWTSGYDLYSPRISVCTHAYGRTKQPSVYIDVKDWSEKQKEAHNKLNKIMNGEIVKCYGPGKNRTVKQYLKFAKIDLTKKTIGEHCI